MASRNYTVTTNQIEPGTIGKLRGKVSFSHISQVMSDAEIKKENDRRASIPNSNMSPLNPDFPYSYIEIYDVQVIAENPNAVSLFETFLQEHCFQTPNSKKHPNAWCYSGKQTKGVPKLYQASPDGKSLDEVVLEEGQELAEGLDVTLWLRVFKPKGKPMNGVALDTVVINEPLKFYERQKGIDLAAQGYIVNSAPKAASSVGQQVAAPTPEQDSAPAVQTQTQQTGPTFVPQGQTAVPVQQAQPQSAPPVAQASGPMFVPQGQAAPAAQQVQQGGSAFGTQQSQGISYDPNSDKIY